jgi:perosamine synthetase
MNAGPCMRIKRTLPPAAAPMSGVDIARAAIMSLAGPHAEKRFKKELLENFKVKHCFLVSSGKAALYCILKSLCRLHPDRNEVLIPAFNCYSVPSAVVAAGLRIRLCDVDSATLDFDSAKLAESLQDQRRLLCIVPTHLFGLHANVERLRPLIKDPGVSIVEDAAQVMGSMEAGKPCGTRGDIGFFSLGRGKAFSAYEGGIIVTDNDAAAQCLEEVVGALPDYTPLQTLRLLINAIALWLLADPRFFWLPSGLPFLRLGETIFERSFPLRKLSPLQIGLARNWQPRLRRISAQRRKNAEHWTSFFNATPLPGIEPLVKSIGALPDLLRFPILVSDTRKRDVLLQKSAEQGLGLSITYPKSLDALPELKNQVTEEYPHATQCAATIVTLPIHCFLQKNDFKKIGDLLKTTVEAKK